MTLQARHNVRIWGEGPQALVFGHGLGTNQSIWRPVAEKMARAHRIVLLDWYGCGKADASPSEAERHRSLVGHATDLCDILKELELGRVAFVGHSAGSMIGVLAAVREPELFERLVLLMASPRYLNDPPDYFGGFTEADVEGVLQLMRENFEGWTSTFAAIAAKDAEIAKELEATFRENDPRHLLEFAETVLRSDFRHELPQLRVPALVLGSSNDDMVPVSVSEYLHRHLPGSSYECLELAGHCPQLARPDDVAETIEAYLQRR